MMVDNNTQIPSRIKALIDKTGEDPGPVLADMARGLEAIGVKALAIPCNTAHHYATIIEKAVDIRLLNIVTLSSSRTHELKQTVNRVGILASPAVQATQIFDSAFELSGIKTVYPATTHVIFEPLDFISKLAALVPKPRVNLTRYHGVFAPNSKHRALVTPGGRGRRRKVKADDDSHDKSPEERRASMNWAQRLKRVFNIDAEVCDQCGGTVKLIAGIDATWFPVFLQSAA